MLKGQILVAGVLFVSRRQSFIMIPLVPYKGLKVEVGRMLYVFKPTVAKPQLQDKHPAPALPRFLFGVDFEQN